MHAKINSVDDTPATLGGMEPTSAPGWRSAVRAGFLYWLLGRILLAAVEVMALAVNSGSGRCLWFPQPRGVLGQAFYNLTQWDGCNYAAIAAQGYPTTVTDGTMFRPGWSVEFFTAWPPLFPLVTRAFDLILPGPATVAVAFTANIAAVGLMIMLARFMQTELGVEAGNRTVLIFAAFPTAMFLAVGYSESLFLLLSVACLYLARRQRWWLAGLAGALAGATRVVGVMLAAALLYEYLRQRGFAWRKIRLDVLAIGLVPVGLGLYMLFLWKTFGDPLVFSKVQALWRHETAPPWSGILRAFELIRPNHDRVIAWRNIADLGATFATLALLVLSVVGPWKLRRDQFFLVIFGALPFLMALCQPLLHSGIPLASLNRYALAVIPIFMVLSRMLARRTLVEAYLFAALPIQAALLLLFIRGSWAG